MDQKIIDLNNGEREWLNNNLTGIRGLVSSIIGLDDIDCLLPSYLEESYKVWFASHNRGVDDPNPMINAFGIGFGQYLVDNNNLEWKNLQDEFGTEIAVYRTPGDILLFPPNLVAKRYEKEEIEFFVPLYNGIKKQIEEIHSNFG